MIHDNIQIILYVTGTITASMLLQFVAPARMLKVGNQLEVSDPVALFFARAAGLAIGLQGALLIWAAVDPALRIPVVTVVAIGKTGFIGTVLLQSKSISKGYVLTMVFDTACVLAYVAFLLGF
jgi:hypothetical protein